ncbi:MAG: hypothetical protein QXP58_07660 [Thermoprotei archaeon]
MSFSIAVFLASLWGLSSEMIEDAAVDVIYARIFGVRKLILYLVLSVLMLTGLLLVLVFIFRTQLLPYLPYASKLSAIVLGGVGIYWITFSIKGGEQYESKKEDIPFLLVFTEMFELFLILLPLSLTDYLLEAAASAVGAVVVSLTVALMLRTLLRDFLQRLRIQFLKFFSGIALILLAVFLLS